MECIIETGVQNLRQKILLMASQSNAAVTLAMEALAGRDIRLAQKIKEDDHLIDQMEVSIDELAMNLLTHAPLASDLRFITAALRITNNLERIGDEAAKIAKRARDLAMEPAIDLHLDFLGMARQALAMLNDALDAFATLDSAAARQVILCDCQLDALYRQKQAELTRHMIGHPGDIVRCLHWLVVVKSLERIGDHATNIAEDVVFLGEAQDVRHSGLKNPTAPP